MCKNKQYDAIVILSTKKNKIYELFKHNSAAFKQTKMSFLYSLLLVLYFNIEYFTFLIQKWKYYMVSTVQGFGSVKIQKKYICAVLAFLPNHGILLSE